MLKTYGEWNTTSARRQVQTPDIWAPSLQEESLPEESTLTTETQERASLPGLLMEANRIMGGQAPNRDNNNNKLQRLPAQSTLTTETQERARLPGLLREANRITGGTSFNQRQL